jgi:hypothetical protein
VPAAEEVRIMPERGPAGAPEPAGRPPADERRASPRLRYAFSGPVVRYLVRPGLEVRQAVLQDLSADGAALLMASPPEPGAVLLVQLGRSLRLGASHTRLAHVVHVTPQQGRVSLVGCRFTPPLSRFELEDVARLFAAFQ